MVPSDDQVLRTYQESGNNSTKAARALGINESTVRRRIEKLNAKSPRIFDSTVLDKANRIVQLLEDAKIPIDAIGQVKDVKVSSWGTAMKLIKRDKSGKILSEVPFTQPNHGTSFVFSPSWESGPSWPVVQPAKPVLVKYTAPTVIVPKGLRTAVVLPDVQFGFLRRVDTGEMLPMHDEAAVDVAAQLVAAIQPSEMVHVGDLIDFSEMSRYLQVEEFFRTTQPAIDAAYAWLARLEAVAGKRKIKTRFVAGNHERRLSEYVQKNARAAFRLRPAMSSPTDWPDASLPRLLRFDDLGIEYMGEWPGSEAWLVRDGDPLVVMHDPKPRGIVYASIIAGHSHHHRETTFAVRGPMGGHMTFTHYEIGCLCSLDTNPDKLSLQRTRVPSDRGSVSGWSQGIAVVEILEKTGQHQLTFVPIKGGKALFRGQIFGSAKAA